MLIFLYYLILLSLFLVTKAVYPQTFNAGITGGINISQIDGDGFSGYNKAGATYGIFANTFFMNSWAGQLEISYSSKGSQLETSIENPQYYRIDLKYIMIPLCIRYFITSEIAIESGLAVGYLFNVREKDELGELPDAKPFDKTEFSAITGIAWFFKERLSLNGRFSYSIVPVRKHAGGGTYYFNRGQNNNVISFILQYQL